MTKDSGIVYCFGILGPPKLSVAENQVLSCLLYEKSGADCVCYHRQVFNLKLHFPQHLVLGVLRFHLCIDTSMVYADLKM
jgi:hypothetical protein